MSEAFKLDTLPDQATISFLCKKSSQLSTLPEKHIAKFKDVSTLIAPILEKTPFDLICAQNNICHLINGFMVVNNGTMLLDETNRLLSANVKTWLTFFN